MKRAYLAISYAGRHRLADELEIICRTLTAGNIVPFVFVDHFTFQPEEESAMMQQAMKEIEQSDILIAAASEKAIGIGIEAGYAKAKGKPVIYIRNEAAPHSTTLAGLSDDRIIYATFTDLANKLSGIICKY